MAKWSKAQDDLLRKYGNHGAAACAKALREQLGVDRTPQAVSRHAYRAGISIVMYEVCPNCGLKVRSLKASGVCPVCHQRRLAESQAEFNRRLLSEIRDCEQSGAFQEAKRDYQKARQQTSRICRKHGVPNKKERKDGDFAKCRNKMSNTRSDEEKKFA